MDGYIQILLGDMLNEFRDDRNKVKNIISDFSCPLNEDVERFLKHTAITFDEQAVSRTYLVFHSYKNSPVLVGYYTICFKTIEVEKSALSLKLKKRLNKFAAYDPEYKNYRIASPLIAQLSKNYNNGYNKLISGDELLNMAINRVKEIQRLSGGKTVYLECEDKQKLLDFYTRHGFIVFNKRMLEKDETQVMHGDYLMQLLRYLD